MWHIRMVYYDSRDYSIRTHTNLHHFRDFKLLLLLHQLRPSRQRLGEASQNLRIIKYGRIISRFGMSPKVSGSSAED